MDEKSLFEALMDVFMVSLSLVEFIKYYEILDRAHDDQKAFDVSLLRIQ